MSRRSRLSREHYGAPAVADPNSISLESLYSRLCKSCLLVSNIAELLPWFSNEHNLSPFQRFLRSVLVCITSSQRVYCPYHWSACVPVQSMVRSMTSDGPEKRGRREDGSALTRVPLSERLRFWMEASRA
jgi:hypothetical protein